MAALLGAHIIKVKLPSAHIEQPEAKQAYAGQDWSNQAERVRHVVQCCFAGRRMVVFSGGAAKGVDGVLQDARDIRDGGGNGSIIGRNAFQRPRAEAMAMLDKLVPASTRARSKSFLLSRLRGEGRVRVYGVGRRAERRRPSPRSSPASGEEGLSSRPIGPRSTAISKRG